MQSVGKFFVQVLVKGLLNKIFFNNLWTVLGHKGLNPEAAQDLR